MTDTLIPIIATPTPTAHAVTLMATKQLLAKQAQIDGLVAERDALQLENTRLYAIIELLEQTCAKLRGEAAP